MRFVFCRGIWDVAADSSELLSEAFYWAASMFLPMTGIISKGPGSLCLYMASSKTMMLNADPTSR